MNPVLPCADRASACCLWRQRITQLSCATQHVPLGWNLPERGSQPEFPVPE